MNDSKSQILFNEIYAEGDIDIIFFGSICGNVNHDINDNSYNKPDEKIFDDAIKIIKYLVVTVEDFKVGRMRQINGSVKFITYPNGFVDFESDALQCMRENGLRCDALTWEIALQKIHIGKVAPIMPESIQVLVRKPV